MNGLTRNNHEFYLNLPTSHISTKITANVFNVKENFMYTVRYNKQDGQ